MAGYRTKPIDGPLGAEIVGLDFNDLSPLTAQSLRSDLAENLLLFIRGQEIKQEKHLELAKCFGTPEFHDFVPGMKGQAEITEIRKEPGHAHNFGGKWHFDQSYRAAPPIGAVLVAREIPKSGGDTVWSNQYLAFDTLTAELKARIHKLKAIHSSNMAFGGFAGGSDTIRNIHPLAPVHRITQRHHLFINPVSIEQINGATPEENDELIEILYKHAIDEKFQYRHKWQEGDIVIWDNMATMHMALNDYGGQRRVMHRISVTA